MSLYTIFNHIFAFTSFLKGPAAWQMNEVEIFRVESQLIRGLKSCMHNSNKGIRKRLFKIVRDGV